MRGSGGPGPIDPPDLVEPPPFGGTWNVLYAIVLLNLMLLIALFYAFTKAFS